LKKALVVAIALVIGLGALAFAGPLSGSWESELTIGFQDVEFTVPGQSITLPGQSLAVSQGVVTIPAKTIPIVFDSKTYNISIPAQNVLVGPFTAHFTGGTYDAVGGTVTIPDQTLTVDINGTTITVPVPGNTADVTPGSVNLTYAPTDAYWTDLGGSQTGSVTITSGSYTESYTCGTCSTTITLPAIDVDVTVGSVVETITIPELDVAVNCSEAGPITVPARTGTGTHYSVTIPAQTLVKGTDYICSPPSVTLPASSVNVTVDGITGTVFVHGGTYLVTGSTVTILDQDINIPAESVEIPAQTVTVTVDGQDLTYTIPSYTVNVSGQTATLPDLTVTVAPVTATTTAKIPSLGFTSTLIVDYTVGGWVFNSTSKFDDTGWIAQSFAATGVLGAFSLTSDLVFAPATAAFTSWDSTGSVSIAGVAFSGEFFLTGVGSGWTFGASGGAGDLTLGATVYLNMDSDGDLVANEYCFCFSSVDFDVSFPFACIDLVDISLGFSTAGFDGITFSATGIAVPGIAWLTFDADLTFDDGTDGKVLEITPAINLGDFTCITLYYDLLTSDTWHIDGIYFYGIEMSSGDLWPGVTFTSLSAFDPADPKDLVLDPYWEVFTIASEADACCGGGFDFSVATYFEQESGMLFDWGQSTVKVSMGLGSNYTAWTGLTVTDAGLTEWILGFKVIW